MLWSRINENWRSKSRPNGPRNRDIATTPIRCTIRWCVHSSANFIGWLADRYELCVAKRGYSDRDQALTVALEHDEQDWSSRHF